MNPSIHTITETHSYRAVLLPDHVPAQDVEALADAQQLPTIRVRAANATHATTSAARVTGRNVLRVERVEC
ncbi:hypothetical protein G7047_13420 [Diaphorobacter sp. HDW4A]|uniref:hypothetical protein n=1 Tax=Diaphorobacter sp. HDW4A TaxID=2714924 RepID=UPI00140B759D|nr:hypothetical protein [Diaphorobacter sp. HDW4A]QIL78490.1 hypothetical protein G7047_00065 [Diaphorobacter sp. HDW4A]QIL80794.1 hypothetical protein G7047_13420 [Diaphorobacter sp. HDW4A]